MQQFPPVNEHSCKSSPFNFFASFGANDANHPQYSYALVHFPAKIFGKWPYTL